jgi:hypothetical protein
LSRFATDNPATSIGCREYDTIALKLGLCHGQQLAQQDYRSLSLQKWPTNRRSCRTTA